MGLHALALLRWGRLRAIGRTWLVFEGLLGHDALLLLPPAEECHARTDAGRARDHTSLKSEKYDASPQTRDVRQRTRVENIAMVASDRMSAKSAFGAVTQA